MNDLLNIRNLSKHYDGFNLQDVALRVPSGSVVGFVGSNGAGKTTTIKSILGLNRPDSGQIALFGEEIIGAPSKRLAELKQRIGVVFDTCSFPEELTVEAVGKLMSVSYRAWDAAGFRERIEQFALPSNKTVKDLSRGMSMKLSLACALSHDADLLILDEATAGLDPMARDEALDTLRAFMTDERHGILMSSHITSDLEKIADYIVCIDEGRIVFSIEKDAIVHQAGIAQCRASEFAAIADSGLYAPGCLRYIRNAYGTSVLVPDRFVFAENFRGIAMERADIDAYMSLMLKGEAL
ncbi:ABC transporter ATP-binding protein [Paraeggerthella hongkongensis]|uniref:ABC transporter n=1 Tax=Paraeggerthella hongkongensis TaxID=230658 RepID=A0A3N0BKV2_9ACTN|nr:ABC transporter ATP-binding protein [Paraeggerthella hongkongensis]RNL49069.1 ABC transporter [Paraeggerthella hongkongensis]